MLDLALGDFDVLAGLLGGVFVPTDVPALAFVAEPLAAPGLTPLATPGLVPLATPGLVPLATPGLVPLVTPGLVPLLAPGLVPFVGVTLFSPGDGISLPAVGVLLDAAEYPANPLDVTTADLTDADECELVGLPGDDPADGGEVTALQASIFAGVADLTDA